MESKITSHGEWYIPETDETISGTLQINKKSKQIILTLVALATENDPLGKIKVFGRTDFIKGKLSSGGNILLFDCNIGGQHQELLRRTTVVVTVKYAFWNLDLNDKQDLEFKKAKVNFGEIIQWSGLCAFDWEIQSDQNTEMLKWECKDNIKFDIDDNLKLEIEPQLGPQSYYVTSNEMTINQYVFMYFEYLEAVSWNVILDDIKTLNSLLILGMNRSVYIDEIWYFHESHISQHGCIQEMEVFQGNFVEGKHQPGIWHDYLFDINDLVNNNFNCLKNWYSKYEKLRVIVNLYESAFVFKDISMEILFLNLAQALETYHARFVSDNLNEYIDLVDDFLRRTFELSQEDEFSEHIGSYRKILIAQDANKKFITLKSRLGYLFLAKFEFVFSFLDYNRGDFIQTTLDTRNYFTHYSADKENKIFPKEKLPYVNGILIAVLQYYLLKEIGIDENKIAEKVGQQIGGIETAYQLDNKVFINPIESC
ncbi:HEPN domain-containing protein [Acetobacterium carbinolicum]|uniref:ApeA N-terminal domain 1-containing protein n=1 Tax=Acetobacterium carbinolicum TaxID=52690 RepID=UPI0039C9EAC7